MALEKELLEGLKDRFMDLKQDLIAEIRRIDSEHRDDMNEVRKANTSLRVDHEKLKAQVNTRVVMLSAGITIVVSIIIALI